MPGELIIPVKFKSRVCVCVCVCVCTSVWKKERYIYIFTAKNTQIYKWPFAKISCDKTFNLAIEFLDK